MAEQDTTRDTPSPPPPSRVRALVRACVSLQVPVTRAQYLVAGFLLMALKFGIERAIFSAMVGRELSLVGFLSPFFADRAALLHGAPDGATWALLGLAMPFLWIGVSMSVRRALDAGWPPMIGFLFLIPGLSYLLMLGLSLAPTKAPPERSAGAGAYRPAPLQEELPKEAPSTKLRAVRAVLASATFGFAMFGACVYVFQSYGSALFIVTPFVMGMIAAMAFRSGTPAASAAEPERTSDPRSGPPSTTMGTFRRDMPIAAGCGLIGIVVVGVGLLCTAFEGGGCVAMALVPAGLLSVLGSLLAYGVHALARASRAHSIGVVLLVPLAAGVEAKLERAPLNEVVTTVVVDAPPEVVWRHVVSFPDLAPPTERLFRAGISYPVRARIEGEGVGAIRYCEFSTGSFVEPITRWEAPRRLSFDVAESPEPMREWTFWDRVDAPHLHGFMASRRGEFRLVALPGGKTRLEGSTFYELQIFPELYWKVWTDGIVHAIHLRVLEHIRRLSEADARR